jgi:hypothetical protein
MENTEDNQKDIPRIRAFREKQTSKPPPDRRIKTA